MGGQPTLQKRRSSSVRTQTLHAVAAATGSRRSNVGGQQKLHQPLWAAAALSNAPSSSVARESSPRGGDGNGGLSPGRVGVGRIAELLRGQGRGPDKKKKKKKKKKKVLCVDTS